ncbi:MULTISPECIES: dipeptidase PepV [Lactococcus]|uniref:dipeptidase PepV n=1 Tax=Lactococcus TaxID=1357 RepID=UPI001CDCEF7B|nr:MULTISPECIES: dipeptidase PepV [Lactococcus]MCA2391190.1 dipeptidase PepV [Lactococcus sp. NH2-7C]MCI1072666.1 dipeptidase PepV [Lactococcus lactis]MCT1183734.1 dipeptidase PepV [Lactococcus lactis]MCT1195392.1 dipeptidase PepV [Lactococcus lactis]WGV30203.1 dipeptidase PepV [Lactococcus sp. NH2-7C]
MTTIDFKAEVEKRKDALMEDLFSLLRIDSAMDMEHADAENPFGPGPRKALDAFLKIAERDGYTTKNYDNYVGHFEYENGASDDAEVLGIIGHLDVVPAGSGWDSNPFEPEIRNGNLYARGASDDKGPTVACYYALKILKELNLPLSKKIRFIVGTNEETGWADMDYYFEHCELPLPDFGFSPDAEFPIINGEKGNITEYLHFAGKNAGEVVLHSFKAGLAENMVPESATAVISGAKDLQAALEKFVAENASKNLRFDLEETDGKATITLYGKSAHGAMPEKGVNGATYLTLFLNQFNFADGAAAFIKVGAEKLLEDHEGEKLGTAYVDELMGNTSMNAGVWSFDENSEGKIALNFRFPQGNSPERMQEILAKLDGVVEVELSKHLHVPHYVPMSDPLVSTLIDVYEKHTGLKGYETIIGGGTFGRLLERGVAYGAMFEGEPDSMHQANEMKPVENIYKAAVIYAEAIYELTK